MDHTKGGDEMNLQVLVATMNQTDRSLVETMNIDSEAIIANQCEQVGLEEFDYRNHKVKVYSFNDRGIGMNRSNALIRANADLCILADDDIVYYDNYNELIIKSFEEHKDADVILFNFDEAVSKRFVISKKMKIGYFNYMRFGAVRIAFRRRSVVKHGINFNILFGGGTEFSGGEDTLFLKSCLDHKLKIIALPITLGKLEETRPSTWFDGYTENYFINRGALFAALSPRFAKLLCIQFILRRFKSFDSKLTPNKAFQLMVEGIRRFSS
jgi:glycosyltransferase involved in cell wall biosynthesis